MTHRHHDVPVRREHTFRREVGQRTSRSLYPTDADLIARLAADVINTGDAVPPRPGQKKLLAAVIDAFVEGLGKDNVSSLPVWLTLASLPFVFVFSLIANYQGQFLRIDAHTRDDPKARRRAKLALLTGYGLHNHEMAAFRGMAYTDLASAKTWREARKVVAYRRAEARVAEATKDLAAGRLVRYEGIAGTDWEGRPYDEREFEETKTALEFLASVHRARYENGRYRRDLMKIVKGIVSRTLPDEGFVMTIAKDRRSWFAWRRTIGGWYLGVGAIGAPTEDWVYLGEHAPQSFPSARTGWHEGEFPSTIDSDRELD